MPGRWKMGPTGGYWDPNDDGPDQYTPTPGEQAQASPQPQGQPGAGPGDIAPIDLGGGRTTANDGWGRDWKNGGRWNGPLTIEPGADGAATWSQGDQAGTGQMAQFFDYLKQQHGMGAPQQSMADAVSGKAGAVSRNPIAGVAGGIPGVSPSGIGSAMRTGAAKGIGGLGAVGRGMFGGMFGR